MVRGMIARTWSICTSPNPTKEQISPITANRTKSSIPLMNKRPVASPPHRVKVLKSGLTPDSCNPQQRHNDVTDKANSQGDACPHRVNIKDVMIRCDPSRTKARQCYERPRDHSNKCLTEQECPGSLREGIPSVFDGLKRA